MLVLFAQRAFQPAGGAGTPPAAAQAGVWAFLVVLLICVLVAVAIGIVVQVFFCLNLSRLLRRIHPDNREIQPGEVWLLFIPLFSLYWIFAMTGRIATSLDNEYYERRWRPDGDFCRQIGMWWGICSIASVVPYIGVIPGIGSLVLYIIYWVKTYGYRMRLEKRQYRDEDQDDGYVEHDDPRRDEYEERRTRDDRDER